MAGADPFAPPDVSPQGPPAGPRPAAGLVALLMAVSFVCYVNRVCIATAGESRIMAQYGLSPTRMGVVYSSFLFAYTIFMIPGGLFIDRFGPRAALALVTGGSAVFVALTGLVGFAVRDATAAFAALLLVRGLMGVVSAPLYPSCASAVGLWVPAGYRSRTNGLVTGAALVGVAVTPLLFGGLIDALDWPSAFVVSAVPTFALAAAWWAIAPAGPGVARPASGRPGESWWRLLRHRGLALLTLSYAAVGYFQYLFFYWMSYYFNEILRLPESTSRAYAALPPLAMAVGMPLGGLLSDRLERASGGFRGRRVVPMLGMTAGGVLLLAGLLAREPAWIVAWFSLALGAVGTSEGPFWLTAVELGRRRGGSAAALFNTGGNLGGMLAPVLTPWVGDRLGWGWSVALGGLICLAGVLLWLGIRPESPHEPRAPLPAGAPRAGGGVAEGGGSSPSGDRASGPIGSSS